MSVGQLTLLEGVGGWEELQVREGDEDSQVLLIQRNKVMVLKLTEASILQTWFGPPNQHIVAAVRNQDVFENCSAVVGFGNNQVALVNNLGSKINAFKRFQLGKSLVSILEVKGDHVGDQVGVLEDGSLVSLRQAQEGEATYSNSILNNKEVLLEARLVETVSSLYVVYVVEDNNNNLRLLKSRLIVSEGGVSASSTTNMLLGNRSEILSWNIYCGDQPYVILWKKSGSIEVSRSMEEGGWVKVYQLENCSDANIAVLSAQFFAVVYTKKGDDGGKLKIISVDYKVCTSEAKLKTTVHKGRGLYYLRNHLFTVGGGRIAFAPVTDLFKEQDEYLGVNLNPELSDELPSAQQLYNQLPQLYAAANIQGILELFNSCVDVPEDTVVDFLDFISSTDKHNLSEEERTEALRQVFMLDLSDAILLQELSRLSLDQVLQLLKTVCSLLQSGELSAQSEKRFLNWIELLLGNNYVQIVLSKDEKATSVLSDVYDLVTGMEKSLKEFARVSTTLNLLSTINLDTQVEEKLPYDIQIIEL